MYRNSGTEKGYEDAIPIKRSKRAERARSEMRKNAANKKNSVDFVISQSAAETRRVKPITVSAAPAESRQMPKVPQRNVKNQPQRETAAAKPAVNPAAASASIQADKNETNKNTVRSRTVRSVTGDSFPSAPAADKKFTSAQPAVKNGDTSEGNYRSMSAIRTSLRDESASDGIQSEPLQEERKLTVGKIVRRSLLSVFTALILAVAALFGVCYTVAVGPSEGVRNILVLSALQASATKWVPGLFLDDEVVAQILEDSKKVNKDVISAEDYQNEQNNAENKDKWASAIDGMIYESVSGPTFKGYVLLVKDPKRVTVGVATDNFTNDTPGLRIFDMAEKYGAVAAINGGEYPDAGGMGIGGRPIGLTYSDGKCVWNDGLRRTFMGFDNNDKLIVREGLTKAEADEMGIRDGVCFQTGKTLITNEDGNVTLYYADNDTGTAQRTAIGQAADGTVIMLVTDGRTASSLGATHNDVIDVMVSYGAISAGMLDGGSSSLMYYKDFYDKYGLDKSGLDEYQRMGLINKYKAFTTPRRLPTCFIVAAE